MRGKYQTAIAWTGILQNLKMLCEASGTFFNTWSMLHSLWQGKHSLTHVNHLCKCKHSFQHLFLLFLSFSSCFTSSLLSLFQRLHASNVFAYSKIISSFPCTAKYAIHWTTETQSSITYKTLITNVYWILGNNLHSLLSGPVLKYSWEVFPYCYISHEK